MKKELIVAIACAFSILTFSCKENVQKTEIDANGVKTITLSSMEESFQDTSYFKDPKIVVLETRDESLLSEIARIFIDDNILFIYDQPLNNIFMFDTTGKYISKIDCKGQGPGEYVQLADFTIDTVNKQIIILCSIPEKRMYFTYDGEFVKEERNPHFYSRLTTDGNCVYFEKSILENPNSQLHILDTKTGEKKEGLEPLGIKNPYYIDGNSFTRGKDILYARRYDNSIYELANGEIVKKYNIDFKKHSFPEWFISEKDAMVISDECRSNEYIFSMSNVIDNNKFMIFYTNRGLFLFDKKNDVLTGHKEMLNSKLNPFIKNESFRFYFPIENTDKIACLIDDPSYIKNIAKNRSKLFKNGRYTGQEDPKLVDEIIQVGSKITDDNNPVLFIYEPKN